MITLDEARAAIEAVVAERPDYVYVKPTKPSAFSGRDYEVCAYFDSDNNPSCLVGKAFAGDLRAAGVEWGTQHNEDGAETVFSAEHGIVPADDAARAFLTNVQHFQDNGSPWGEALRRALEEPAYGIDSNGVYYTSTVEDDE